MIPRLTADNMAKKSTGIMSGRHELPKDTSQYSKTQVSCCCIYLNNILFVPKQVTAQGAPTSYYQHLLIHHSW